jgi:hypothetical protein
MMEAFRLGGFGMYPTLVAGILLVVTAVRYARKPEHDSRPLIRQLSILTALVGTLGFITGVIHCFIACGSAPVNEIPIYVVVGTGESLCNVGLALVMLVAARAATSFGTYRSGSRGPATLHDPHAR